jgi:hypothetical protein
LTFVEVIVIDAPYQNISRATPHHDESLVVHETRVQLFISNAWPYLWTRKLYREEGIIVVEVFADLLVVNRRKIKQAACSIV